MDVHPFLSESSQRVSETWSQQIVATPDSLSKWDEMISGNGIEDMSDVTIVKLGLTPTVRLRGIIVSGHQFCATRVLAYFSSLHTICGRARIAGRMAL